MTLFAGWMGLYLKIAGWYVECIKLIFNFAWIAAESPAHNRALALLSDFQIR